MRRDCRSHPLRKVTGHRNGLDVLECGHELAGADDIYGPRFPDKRRCWHCWAALSAKEKQAILDKRIATKKKRIEAEWEAWRKYSKFNQEGNS